MLVHSDQEVFPQPVAVSISDIPVPIDVVWTTSAVEANLPRSEDFGSNVSQARVLNVREGTSSWAALLAVVNAGLLESYDLVLRVDASGQANELHLNEEWELQGASLFKFAPLILANLAEDPSIGIVSAEAAPGTNLSSRDAHRLSHELLRRLELKAEDFDLQSSVSSSYWARAFLLNGLRALELSDHDFGTSAEEHIEMQDALSLMLWFLCKEAGFRLLRLEEVHPVTSSNLWRRYLPTTPRLPEARIVPFYLPQFHAFPENDSWWGKGFTEWSNAASAKPNFRGHRQPILPGDFGFYDLSNDSVRQQQFNAALNVGVEGFMYYYYWFAGKRLMSAPVEQLVKSRDSHPFCLMWANENWTRRWDGGDENILMAQEHDWVPPEQFIDDVREFITDERYLKVEGKPVLAVYKISQLPKFQKVLSAWRERAVAFGLPGLHLVSVDIGPQRDGLQGNVQSQGLDGTLEFAPHNGAWVPADTTELEFVPQFRGHVLDYAALSAAACSQLRSGIETYRYPGVMVNFDNTARRQHDPHLWVGANPYTFRRWLREAVLGVQDRAPEKRFVFINAWNEWAEGAILEPSQRFGRTYLQAVESAVFAS